LQRKKKEEGRMGGGGDLVIKTLLDLLKEYNDDTSIG